MAANGAAALRFDLSDSGEAALEFTKQDGPRVKTTPAGISLNASLQGEYLHFCTS